ncbi:GNAT family acetyltransferase [Chlorella sorokiniana]|uniref:GNAT family acetyltransferase n=1 Tax=Chlorella sorokiniana TaxID=3076 RepID=A0A2P6TKD9_CHLSO|nr:GNAT family acetyltransferase [Chlorella sorokiniana]|eukprot:PRW44537.1 GNAT family acetyltransferase [Chlorella sorokiniana]
MSPPVVVRACSSAADCALVAKLCGDSFPEECHGQGLSVAEWQQIEAEELSRTPSWWRQIGLACEGDKLLGVVVLTLENEEDDAISWSEYSRRVGCGPTVLSMLYDRVLDEALLEHECLIDFIAVSPDARGKGVGALLMRWAEQTGAAILAETEADAVAANGVDMTLWVAADNAAAVRLYTKSGYVPVKRTDRGACNCLASRVLNFFLGHSVWIKMRKPLPPPGHLVAAQPAPQSMPVAVASGAAAGEAQFEDVALEAAQQSPAAQPAAARMGCFGRRQPQPAAAAARAAAAAGDSETGMAAPPAPGIHAGSLLRKLSNGAGVLGPLPASQGPTPRIGAVPASGFSGSSAPAGGAAQPPAYGRVSSLKEGGGYTQLELRAMPASSDGGASHAEPAKLFVEAAAGAPAPAPSASVASIDSDSEADGPAGISDAPAGDVFVIMPLPEASQPGLA